MLSWLPGFAPGATINVGYAHHDARFVDFTFVTPDSQQHDVSGNRLELVPQHMVNARVSYASRIGVGVSWPCATRASARSTGATRSSPTPTASGMSVFRGTASRGW